MVVLMGKNSQQVKKAMTLWLLLEEIGYHDLIRMINSYDTKTVDALFNAALKCLECMQPNALPNELEDNTPVLLGLFEEPLHLRFFYYNREFMYKRYLHIKKTVSDKIFGQDAAIEVDESGTRPVVVGRRREGSSGDGTVMVTQGAYTEHSEVLWYGREAPKESMLNPDAMEYCPGPTPEDARTMFLTFSKGYPLSSKEIVNFFVSKWGEVVQDVVIEHTREGEEPRFGRIVFTSSTVIQLVLNGEAKAKFLVNGKHLWARVYVPRQRGMKS
ncbi:hypothetical protein CFOL_v3_21462 [Cephalotus follicularis]|uniref:Uncharacterized protein n=1 Tax=Cephalotus follicularis TaxID=3775 RepID=A0A1Q3CCN1_CEPFO|nr:hypothetical protein CFOL_v3_21462 [Cephalotus follicularis]